MLWMCVASRRPARRHDLVQSFGGFPLLGFSDSDRRAPHSARARSFLPSETARLVTGDVDEVKNIGSRLSVNGNPDGPEQ